MIKKTITYTDYNDEVCTEDFYFNINRTELIELQLRYPNGFDNELKEILRKKDNAAMFAMMKDLILSSYGMKSSDGKGFFKRPDLKESFMYHPAFDQLIEDLSSDEDAMTNFVMAVVPGKMSAELKNNPDLLKQKKEELLNEVNG